MPVEAAWRDADARVRRAAAMGSMSRLDTATAASLMRRMVVEPDAVTRIVLAGALARGDVAGVLSISELLQRVAGAQPDAPLAAFAVGLRGADTPDDRLSELLASRDPLVRAHTLRGLGASASFDATARLASAYAWETNPSVRRAAIEALAVRQTVGPRLRRGLVETWDRAVAGARSEALALAAKLDPDSGVRAAARRALAGIGEGRAAGGSEVAWLELVPAEGATLPRDVTALVVTSDGVAIPIAFDGDGYALLPGVSPGPASLRLAASLPPYSSESP
jgi:hypothetical protein